MRRDVNHAFPSPRKNLGSEDRTQNAGGALRADHRQKRGAREGWASPASTQDSEHLEGQAGAFRKRALRPPEPGWWPQGLEPGTAGPRSLGVAGLAAPRATGWAPRLPHCRQAGPATSVPRPAPRNPAAEACSPHEALPWDRCRMGDRGRRGRRRRHRRDPQLLKTPPLRTYPGRGVRLSNHPVAGLKGRAWPGVWRAPEAGGREGPGPGPPAAEGRPAPGLGACAAHAGTGCASVSPLPHSALALHVWRF